MDLKTHKKQRWKIMENQMAERVRKYVTWGGGGGQKPPRNFTKTQQIQSRNKLEQRQKTFPGNIDQKTY